MRGSARCRPSLLLLMAACAAPVQESELAASGAMLFDRPSQGQGSFHTQAERLVFFAVLEGAYVAGVREDAAARLIETGEEMEWPRWFVYSCPICMPAFDALRVYAARPGFFGDKMSADTFGPGLSSERRARLLGEDAPATREVVEELVGEWTRRYLAQLGLGDEERATLEGELAKMRKAGAELLHQYLEPAESQLAPVDEFDEGTRRWLEASRRHYEGWERCPSCEGAKEAGAWRPPAVQ